MNGKRTSMGLDINTNLTTRQRFFQSATGSSWHEELNERVERAQEAWRFGHRTLLEFWIGEGSGKTTTTTTSRTMRKRSLCLDL
jgi:hypothetical protein